MSKTYEEEAIDGAKLMLWALRLELHPDVWEDVNERVQKLIIALQAK